MEKQKKITIFDILSFIKIILIALFMIFYLTPIFYLDGSYPIFAILVFIIYCVLDIITEMNSKQYNLNNFQKVLSPIINKLFRNLVLIAFVINKVMPLFTIIILATIDLITLILGAYLLSKKIIFQANILGKVATVFMSISLFSCFFSVTIYPWNLVLILISTAIVLSSLIFHIVKFYKLYNFTPLNSKK